MDNEFDNSVHELNNQVRELINVPRKHYQLRQDVAFFSQLCSSLDVIGDTEEAIAAYHGKEFGASKAAHYLALYGVLQAIYVQQDAVLNLSESLGIREKIDNYPGLKAVRELRNDVAGHPTKRDKAKGLPTTYHHVSRMTLGHSSFTLLTFFSSGAPFKVRRIDMLQLIAEQKKYISTVLVGLVSKLEAEDKAHKDAFRMEKLVDIFPLTIGYTLEKIAEGVLKDNYAELAPAHLEQLEEVLRKFREAVGHRDKDFYESLEDDYKLVNHCIEYLEGFFLKKEQGVTTEGDTFTAQIFTTYLHDQVEVMKQYAKGIDDEYAD